MKQKNLILFNVILGVTIASFYLNNEKAFALKKYSLDIKQKENKAIEETIENYLSGKIMRYTLYDDLGKQTFTILFDEKGNVENYKGLPLLETYQNKISQARRLKENIKQHLKVGDTLKYHYLIANLPNAKRNFKIKNVAVDDKKTKRILKKMSKTGIDVNQILVKRGINTIEASVTYDFNDKEKTSITYTEIFEVEVY